MDKESQGKSEAVCPSKLELAEVRDKLARAKSGPQYWRSLEELAQTDGFFEMVHREFPRQASVWPEGASRRDFMKLMTASMALAGTVGVREAAGGTDCPIRAAAGADHAGHPVVLCQRDAVWRVCDAGAGGEP